MAVSNVAPGVWQVALSAVNVFLIESPDGLTLIDTGVPKSDAPILAAVKSLGKSPSDVRRIIVTHCHIDHAGGAAALKQATGAEVWMHPVDAALVRRGEFYRKLTPAPGLMNAIIGRLIMWLSPTSMQPCAVDAELHDGQELPALGGLRVIHTPGHCAGQVSLLWPEQGGVLFVADAAANAFGLAASPMYEDFDEGVRSLKKLGALQFEHACFGHGSPIRGQASEKFRAKWS